MKYRLSYLLLFILSFIFSCNNESARTNHLTQDQLRHLVGIDASYRYSTPENFSTELVYVENDTVIFPLTVEASTRDESDTRYRPEDHTNVVGSSKIDLSGRFNLIDASVTMKGDAIIPQAELSISTSTDTVFFNANLNGLYNKPYPDFTTLQTKVLNEGQVDEVVYNNVYVFTPEDAIAKGYDFTGFKEVCFAKDYGFIRVVLEDPTSTTGEYNLEIRTFFMIPGFENGPISSTGVAGYRHADQPANARLLTNQYLYLISNMKELGTEESLWGFTFTDALNDARFAFSGGEVSWNSYLRGPLELDDDGITNAELEYDKVKQQIADITGSSANPQPMVNNDSLNLGAFKWSIFYLSHVNVTNSAEIYGTKLGGPFTVEDSLSLHGDFENLLGFELSTAEQKGKAEITSPKIADFAVPVQAIKRWLIDAERSPSKGGKYENRVFLLNPNYKEIGGFGLTDEGGAVIRCK
ncbi:hypothetical protein [Flammeovirga sp. SJP92]|uniref:hypothetical protein n=1 Tax=Flammeovirga sp. SJP92 TaxID=1775430 RepID=UPI000786C3FC|nr:hypothetical protein [Flammeovirga sp. SJP92]KXX66973.1 hypothetical protein AVL50_28780 [Flammeovirga sp. SJP92]